MKNVTKRSMVNVSRAMSSPSISSPSLSSPAMFTPAKSSVNVQPCNFSGQTNTHTETRTQSDTLIATLRSPIGDGVIILVSLVSPL